MSKKQSPGNVSVEETITSEQNQILPSEIRIRNPRSSQLESYREAILEMHLQIVRSIFDGLQRAVVCGSYLNDVKSIVPHGDFTSWIRDNFAAETGFSERTAQRYMKTAHSFSKFVSADGQSRLEDCLSNPRLLLERVREYHDHCSQDSKTQKATVDPNQWQSPELVIQAVRQVLGGIECDPCASDDGPPVAEIQYRLQDDGLNQPWPGTAWIAPGHTDIDFSQWCKKALSELEAGNLSEAILCLPESELRLVPEMYRYPIAISYLPLTVSYVSGSKSLQKTLPTCSTFVYLSAAPRTEQFASAFREIAAVFQPVMAEKK